MKVETNAAGIPGSELGIYHGMFSTTSVQWQSINVTSRLLHKKGIVYNV